MILAGAIYDNASVRVPSGVIRAFDVETGRLVWNFDPGNPDDTSPIGPDRRYSWSSPNSWSTSSADEDLGLLYVPMGMGAVDQFGGGRPATTERFSASVLALEIDSQAFRVLRGELGQAFELELYGHGIPHRLYRETSGETSRMRAGSLSARSAAIVVMRSSSC